MKTLNNKYIIITKIYDTYRNYIQTMRWVNISFSTNTTATASATATSTTATEISVCKLWT